MTDHQKKTDNSYKEAVRYADRLVSLGLTPEHAARVAASVAVLCPDRGATLMEAVTLKHSKKGYV